MLRDVSEDKIVIIDNLWLYENMFEEYIKKMKMFMMEFKIEFLEEKICFILYGNCDIDVIMLDNLLKI